ncbi:MAG: hypothetical protein KDJ40_09660 [Hyphomicrobiales bacterium]|nr:hypothetical protein [Hyphomicrobiales bacterium]MCO5086299.1 hypothetical protein [Methylobacteriaceae bacterium]
MRSTVAAVIAALIVGVLLGVAATMAVHQYGSDKFVVVAVDRRPLKAATAKLQSQIEIGLTMNELAASLSDIQTQTTLIERSLSPDQLDLAKALVRKGKTVLELWRAALKSECPDRCESQFADGLVELGILKRSVDWYMNENGTRRAMYSEIGGRSGFVSLILSSLSSPLAKAQASL